MTSVHQENVTSVLLTSYLLPTTSNGSDVPDGCTILKMSEDLVSSATEQMVDRVKVGLVVPLCFFVGASTNCINMAVFLRQGLHERINMCLFALSLHEVVYLSAIFFLNAERISALFQQQQRGPVYEFAVGHHLLIFHSFGWTSDFITAVTAVDVCFCIINPLQSKTFLKTRTLAVVLGVSCPLIIAGHLVVTAKWTLTCIYDPERNSTFTRLTTNDYYRRNKKVVDVFDELVFGLLFTGMFDMTVTVCCVIMAVHLKRAVAWRNKTSSAVSTKELRLTKMLVCLSVQYDIFLTPKILFQTAGLFVDGLSGGEKFYNLHFVVRNLKESLSYLKASSHFFFFVFLGSRYRETLKDMCKRVKRS